MLPSLFNSDIIALFFRDSDILVDLLNLANTASCRLGGLSIAFDSTSMSSSFAFLFFGRFGSALVTPFSLFSVASCRGGFCTGSSTSGLLGSFDNFDALIGAFGGIYREYKGAAMVGRFQSPGRHEIGIVLRRFTFSGGVVRHEL
jgi:hypothetical protein